MLISVRGGGVGNRQTFTFAKLLTGILIALLLPVVQAEVTSEELAPLIKENTLFLGHINLKGLDVDAVAQQFEQRFQTVAVTAAILESGEDGLTEKELSKIQKEIKTHVAKEKKMVKRALNKFFEADINDLYLVSVLELMDDYPLIVAVPGQPEMDEEVEEQLEELSLRIAGTKGDWTYFVTCDDEEEAKKFLKAFAKLEAGDRPEIEEALEYYETLPIQFAYTPSASLTAVLKVLVSAIAEQSADDLGIEEEQINTFLQLLSEIEFAAFGCDPAALQLNAVIQFDSEKTAKKAAGLAKNLLTESLKSEEEDTKAVLDLLKPALKDLLPKAKENQLLLDIGEKFFEKHEENLIAAAFLSSLLDQITNDDEEEDEDENGDEDE
ncbi:MAG: hypothetical protein LBQ50_00845 [Planctomycetaceae bacterium]|jgi:hypothetical protein|nr:hypothetical protein [Planctomycetaceae bacterium]